MQVCFNIAVIGVQRAEPWLCRLASPRPRWEEGVWLWLRLLIRVLS